MDLTHLKERKQDVMHCLAYIVDGKSYFESIPAWSPLSVLTLLRKEYAWLTGICMCLNITIHTVQHCHKQQSNKHLQYMMTGRMHNLAIPPRIIVLVTNSERSSCS